MLHIREKSDPHRVVIYTSFQSCEHIILCGYDLDFRFKVAI